MLISSQFTKRGWEWEPPTLHIKALLLDVRANTRAPKDKSLDRGDVNQAFQLFGF